MVFNSTQRREINNSLKCTEGAMTNSNSKRTKDTQPCNPSSWDTEVKRKLSDTAE
jgi:hypothetical protein